MLVKKSLILNIVLFFIIIERSTAQTEGNYLVNEPVDISPDFRNFSNTYFLADSLAAFDPVTVSGTIKWQQNH